jgi:hypothetical protein
MKTDSMAATDNNLRVPNELLDQARRIAEADGCTADELAATALMRYFETRRNVLDLQDLASWGERHAAEHGFKPSDVDQAIQDERHVR